MGIMFLFLLKIVYPFIVYYAESLLIHNQEQNGLQNHAITRTATGIKGKTEKRKTSKNTQALKMC